jgi:uncharacterized membrane protein
MFTSQSKYPIKFIVCWVLWSIIDIIAGIFGYVNNDNAGSCKSPYVIFDLAYWLRIAGILGFLINATTITLEINPYHISNKLAMFVRVFIALLAFIWTNIGIVMFSGIQGMACQQENPSIYYLSIATLVSLLLKTIVVHISTNYSFRCSGVRTSSPMIV